MRPSIFLVLFCFSLMGCGIEANLGFKNDIFAGKDDPRQKAFSHDDYRSEGPLNKTSWGKASGQPAQPAANPSPDNREPKVTEGTSKSIFAF